MTADDALRDEIARALFVEGVGPEAAPAWDAPGDGGRQRWWNYADAILPIVARVEQEAYRRGQADSARG